MGELDWNEKQIAKLERTKKMNTAHTPAKWRVIPGDVEFMIEGPQGRPIANVTGQGKETNEANAYLISASPQMLKALNGVLHHNKAVKEKFKLPASLIAQIEAAIPKQRNCTAADVTFGGRCLNCGGVNEHV